MRIYSHRISHSLLGQLHNTKEAPVENGLEFMRFLLVFASPRGAAIHFLIE